MPVNWSKYGVGSENKEEEQRNSVTRIDWGKYEPETMQRQEGQRNLEKLRNAPDIYNPMQVQQNIKSRFSAPEPVQSTVVTRQPDRPVNTGVGRTPFTPSYLQTEDKPLINNILTGNPRITADDVRNSTGFNRNNNLGGFTTRYESRVKDQIYKDGVISPREKWVEDYVAKSKNVDNPLFRTIGETVEPLTRLIAQFQTLPGVSSFQQGAGQAAGIDNSQFTAPESGPEWLQTTARLAGNVAGGAAGMQGAGIRPVNTFDTISSSVANAAGRAGVTNQVAQRTIGDLAAGGVEGAAASAIAGQTDAKDLLLAGSLGAATGGLLDGGTAAVGQAVRGARNAAEGAIGNQLRAVNALESASRSVPTERLRVQTNTERLSRLMGEIKPVVTERMTPPLENPRELAKWLKPHLGDVSLNEINKLPYEDMRQLAQEVQRSMSVPDVARQVARERGVDLDPLLDNTAPTIRQAAERLRMAGVAGAIDPPPNVRVALGGEHPRNANKTTKSPRSAQREPVIVEQARAKADTTPNETPLTRPLVDDDTLVKGNMDTQARKPRGTREPSIPSTGTTDELKFAETVRESQNTPQMLRELLEDSRLTGARTNDKLNAQAAQNLIDKYGPEAVADRLVGKKTTLNAVENTAAQVLARYYAEIGDLERSVSIISKTAQSGRELGQAVQALSKWNKLSQEGALILAERQLNRRNRNTDAWQKLSVEQAAPIQQAARGIEQADNLQQLTQQVVDMLAKRPKNMPFMPEEQALLKQYSEAVNSFDQNIRPILREEKKAREQTIRKISSIAPAERKRDQVVTLLNAQADKAREALRAQRNMGIISNQTNPVVLYAVIGASKIAQGAVKFADWSESMIREGITDRLAETYVKSVSKFRKENGLPTNAELNRVINAAIKEKNMTEEMANSFRAMAAEIGFYADDAKLELTRDLQRALRNVVTSTLGEKISALQTSAMLLNVPTFLRNAIGNSSMILSEKINKVAAVPIDWTVSKLTGERTIRFNPGNQEKFWSNFGFGTQAGWEGVTKTGILNSYDLQPNVFSERNPLKYITKTLGASLEGFDYAAYQLAYGDVLSTYATNLGKSQGLSAKEIKAQMPELIKQLDDKILEMADQAGLYATFQDETLLSKGAVAVKRGLNAITDVPMRNLRERGLLPESVSTEGFGLGDIVLKFAKTPANLVMRGIDYSPLGFVRSLIELAPALLKKDFNQRQFVLSLSRAITGTLGFTGLGFILAKNGILTGASSQDKDVRSMQEQAGQGAYKINLSALSRWITSGFDDSEALPVEGDRMIDYAWMQPVAISLGMGVNAAEAMDKPLKPGEERNNYKIAQDAIFGGINTIMENPLVTGLQNVTDAFKRLMDQQDLSGFAYMLQGVPASFIPTIMGQVRTGMDNTQREAFDSNFLDAMMNQIKNKTPGASESLPISYNSLGYPRERIQGGESGSLANYLTALLSPVKYTEYNITPEAKIALDIMKESGDANVLPRIGNRKITVTDPKTKLSKSVPLTNEQFSTLQQATGEDVKEAILRNAGYLENPNIRIDQKVKRLKQILTESGKKAKQQLTRELGYK